MSKRPFIDFYVVLGISPSATARQIAAAYRSLARKHHPDSCEAEQGSTKVFKAVAEAYETLSDPKRRREYDRRRREEVRVHPRRGSAARTSQTAGGSAVFGSPSAVGGTAAGGDLGRDDLNQYVLEVPVAPEEARAGAVVTLTLTINRQCEACAGAGCSWCGGQGMARRQRPLHVQLPSGVADGTLFRIPGDNVIIRIRVRPYW